MKRDDQIHPFISGNKWRKLTYNLAEAQALRKTRIATFGGAFSNHLVATACACATHGLSSLGIVRGDELNTSSNYVLRLCKEFGMELRFVSREIYSTKAEMYDELNKEYYVLPEGGDNALGVKGCEEILPEKQTFDHVFVAVGTGTTLSGIIKSAPQQTQVHGIAALKDASYLEDTIRSYTSNTNWKLHTDFALGGFGKFDKNLLEFNRQFASETGVLLDPVYTGKMMSAVYQLVQRGVVKSKQSVLCIHTGGMTGVLTEKWLQMG